MDAASIALVRNRAGGLCEYCHLPQRFSELRFHVEHIIPRQHGGKSVVGNLALACPDCNLVKGPNLTARDPRSRRVVRLFHPRRQRWADHFAYDGALIVGRTTVGRATVALLRMTDAARIRIRALLAG